MEKGRLAPSPSGVLHLGNLASSLLAWLDVRSRGGRLIFRLEDLDPERSYTDYALGMINDLHYLGIDWDEGWSGLSGSGFAQSERTGLYQDAFDMLQRRGMVYPCYCSRSQRLAASAPHPGEDRRDHGCSCRYLTAAERAEIEKSGRRPAWKLRVPDRDIVFTDGHYGRFTENLADSGDFIIKRSDGVFAYQLAVSLDDAEMGVTRVVRGSDLIGSTARQIWLISELGCTPPEYCHAPLLVTDGDRKMSKRFGDLNMDYLRERYSGEEIVGRLAHLLKLRDTDSPVSPQELLNDFDWSRVPMDNIIIP